MEEIHADLENTRFHEPSGLKPVSYCLDSGLLATEYCKLDPRGSRVAEDKIFAEDIPDGLYCTAHTEETVFNLCLDCPILDEAGAETGMYHIAGPYCPEESLMQVCLSGYERLPMGTTVANDDMYRKSVIEAYGICSVHLEPAAGPDPWVPWWPDEWGGGEEAPVQPDTGEGSQDVPPAQDIPSQDVEGNWFQNIWSW